MISNKNADGKLIVVCGIDGSGKTLQSKKLFKRLISEGVKAHYVEFPRYESGFFGQLIAKYLRGETSRDAQHLDPYMAALPFACDRWQYSETMKWWLNDGECVICNRYVTANMAHQGCKIESQNERQQFYDWVQNMEYEVFKIPQPDLNIWLDLKPETALKLIEKKEKRNYLQNKDDIHENFQHLRVARDAYAELAAQCSHWDVVNCNSGEDVKEPDKIAESVWECVRDFLGA